MSEETEKRDQSAKAAGAVHVITIDNELNEDYPYKFYIRKLDRNVVGVAMAKATSDPLGAAKIILDNHLMRDISDVAALDSDDNVFFSVIAQVNGLIEIKSGNLKRL
jgi:hypothetical protein